MAKKPAAVPRGYQSLVDALDCGYRHSNAEMFRWFIVKAFDVMGVTVNEADQIPETARSNVEEALHLYERIVAMEPEFSDVLGPTYMELGSRWGRQSLGQFFTPQPVARMMSEMSAGVSPEGRVIRACDPACGSGVMMLSLAQTVLQNEGPDTLRRYSFTGADLDGLCARMMALQFLANCAIHEIEVGELIVLHGNSLMPWVKMDVVVHATSPSFPGEEVAPAKHPSRLHAIQEVARQTPGLQLGLFEEDAA